MNDDLVKRLRGDWCGYEVSLKAIYAIEEAADRIEQLTAEAAKMLSEADYEYNRKTNDMIQRHAEQVQALIAERDRLRKYLEDLIADCEASYPPSHGAIKYAAKLALKGDTT